VQVTLMSYIGDGGGRPVLDSYIETLAGLRDEGFRRLWSSQLPSEPDLLTLLAVALREVADIEVGSAVLPIQVQHPSQLAQRAPLYPATLPFSLDQFPATPATYVISSDDQMLRPRWSRHIAHDRLGVNIIELPGDHSPFLSRPSDLAELLLRLPPIAE
jgi:hypothetical protein